MIKYVPYVLAAILCYLYLHIEGYSIGKYKNVSLYYALGFMLISTLSYPSRIQYVVRLAASGYASVVILSCYTRKQEGIQYSLKYARNVLFLIVLYLALCFVSALWSEDALETCVKAAEMSIDVLLIVNIIVRNGDTGVRGIAIVICIISGVLLLGSLIGFIFVRSEFSRKCAGLIGIQLNPFLAGADSIAARAVLLIVFVINIQGMKRKGILIALALSVIFLAQARTAVVITGLIFVVWLFCSDIKLSTILIASIVIGAFILNYDRFLEYFNRGAYQSNLETLTGRTIIWQYARDMIVERPILGYGFGVGGFLAASKHHGVTHTHNAFYETAMGLGYLGVGILGLQPLYVANRMVKRFTQGSWKKYAFEIMYIVYIGIRSYTSIGIACWHSTEFICWIFFLMLLATNPRIGSYRVFMRRPYEDIS